MRYKIFGKLFQTNISEKMQKSVIFVLSPQKYGCEDEGRSAWLRLLPNYLRE